MVFRLSGPRLALLIPLVLYSVLESLHALNPGLFCVAVNSGGKEFICGSGYSHVGVRLVQVIGIMAWAVVLLIGGVEVVRGKAERPAAFAWLFSAMLFLTWGVLWLAAPDECAP